MVYNNVANNHQDNKLMKINMHPQFLMSKKINNVILSLQSMRKQEETQCYHNKIKIE